MKAIFYSTSTGNTEEIADKIYKKLEGFELIDISKDGIKKMEECESIIIGSPTWGEGDLQDDWEDCFDELKEFDFSEKIVALFGLGDQDGYPDEFVNAMGTLYEVVKENGAKVVGFTSNNSYEYDFSSADIDGKFIGLVIDEDNQSEFTDERIENWCNDIKNLI